MMLQVESPNRAVGVLFENLEPVTGIEIAGRSVLPGRDEAPGEALAAPSGSTLSEM